MACHGVPGTFSGPSQKGPCRDEAASQETPGQTAKLINGYEWMVEIGKRLGQRKTNWTLLLQTLIGRRCLASALHDVV